MPTITPDLCFDTEAHEAAQFYVSVFPNSSITEVNQVYQPNPANRKLYDDLFTHYVKIYETNKALYKEWDK